MTTQKEIPQKFCKDCKWCNRSGTRTDGFIWDESRADEWMCNWQDVRTDLLTGINTTLTLIRSCRVERMSDHIFDACGGIGRHFTPKE